jgi:hypothetical protein
MLFHLTIGPRGSPRLSFEAISECWLACFAQHVDLVQPCERMAIAFVREVQ